MKKFIMVFGSLHLNMLSSHKMWRNESLHILRACLKVSGLKSKIEKLFTQSTNYVSITYVFRLFLLLFLWCWCHSKHLNIKNYLLAYEKEFYREICQSPYLKLSLWRLSVFLVWRFPKICYMYVFVWSSGRQRHSSVLLTDNNKVLHIVNWLISV